MDPQQLLSAPASTLTRKQRKDRAALKRKMAEAMKLPAGYALGQARTALPERWSGSLIVEDIPGPSAQMVGQQIELGKLHPSSGHVLVRIVDRDRP